MFTIPEFLKKLNKMVFTSQTHLLLLYLMYIMYEKLYTCSILEIHWDPDKRISVSLLDK